MNNIKVVHVVTVSKSVKLMEGQLEYLQQQGFNVTVISSPGPELEEVSKKKINVKPIKIEREIKLISDIFSLINLIVYFRKNKPHLTNVSTPKAGLLGGLAAFISGVPCRIYTMRGLRFETTSGIKRIILKLMEKISCFLAHQVICISPSLKEKALELGIVSERKVIVLGHGSSNGLDINKFPTRASIENQEEILKFRKQLGIPLDSPVMGFVGRLTRDKGIEELIKAFKIVKKDIKDLRLLIVGDFEEGDPVSDATKKEINHNKHIYKLGFLKNPIPYYYIMDVFVFPTHREGFGNVSIEAAAAELPVVTTDATGAIDTVMDNVTGFVVPVGDYNKMADKISFILKQPSIGRKMGKEGRKRVIEKFRSEIIWGELYNLYSKIIKENLKLK
ncbi:glycosyltransferase family 4 protein [Saccharococcus caldoxylosilyticus]|uniref:glycosyltransferase family 4 protein n=1 Tax=Saccharococcus caldoxylosilyticus TaxID=81408 RepID=UPI001FCC81F6|nr:glycosyltransferase family 4 protein [Parageobacillus caldoxylosilyticus]BDG45216.1 glycosyl transferase family 1 [Parageobacillus caldoxylosilyticus]